jgi:hypothetical protein
MEEEQSRFKRSVEKRDLVISLEDQRDGTTKKKARTN